MKFYPLMLFVSLLLVTVQAVDAQDKPTLRLVPTFECCSVYVEGTTLGPEALKLEYRSSNQTNWEQAHALVNSDNDAVPRTSLVDLSPDTAYQVRILDQHGKLIVTDTFTTWSSQQHIAKTITLTAAEVATSGLHITDSGTAQGWVRYVGDGKTVLDVDMKANAAIHVDYAQYIILENLILKGGQRHGIHLDNSSNIIIRNCDISGYGRVGTQRFDLDGKYYDENNKAINWDSGINIDLSKRIVIEYNFIHDPRSTANSWFYSHPSGPNAIFLRTLGQVVIRYNNLIGSNQHRWNDVIEGYGNGKFDGGANCDSDIYGNYLAFGNDDGIELDGGQCNVRFWGNKIEGTLCGISTAANVRGPSFIYRNLVVNLGDERASAGSAVKNGGGDTYTHGISHFYNNTFYTRGSGIRAVGYGKDDNRSMFFGVSRNNLLALSSNGINDPHAPKPCDYDYDLFATPQETAGRYDIGRPMEQHAIMAPAQLRAPLAGDMRPTATSPAVHAGVLIPGFSTGFSSGDRPTIGCFQVDGSATVPGRDLPIEADRQQLDMTVFDSEQNAHAPQVTIHTDRLKAPIGYRIQKNSAFDWLEVTPQTGTFKPGQTQVLTVKVNKTLLPSHGLFPGVFIIKLDDARSLPITVYVKYAGPQFSFSRKAKDCEGADAFTPEAGDEKPVDGDGQGLWFCGQASRVLGTRCLTLNVNVPQSGDYYLHVRVNCPKPGGHHDSAYLSINDEPARQVGVAPGDYWHWVGITGKSQTVSLVKGNNRIRLYPREAIWIDEIQVNTLPLLVGENPQE
jgi:parallel beta-helix repeat protein